MSHKLKSLGIRHAHAAVFWRVLCMGHGRNNDYVAKALCIIFPLASENIVWDEKETFFCISCLFFCQIFDANVDNTTVKIIELQKLILARYIRICPLEWYIWPCMRMELYGSPITKGQSH